MSSGVISLASVLVWCRLPMPGRRTVRGEAGWEPASSFWLLCIVAVVKVVLGLRTERLYRWQLNGETAGEPRSDSISR